MQNFPRSADGDLFAPAFDISSFYDRGAGEGKAVELNQFSRTSKEIQVKPNMVGGGEGVVLDINAWLPSAAEKYNISPDIRDYILVPVPALITDIPNTNGDSLSVRELLDFKPRFGMPMYKTFKGKPTHKEHDNKDYTKAKGIIFDSYVKMLPGFHGKHAKLMMLLGYDRSRDSKLCNEILTDKVNTHSVGFYYTSYTCSFCGHVTTQDTLHFCQHTRLGKRPYSLQDMLVYRRCHDATGFECSHVDNPAYVSNQHLHSQIMKAR